MVVVFGRPGAGKTTISTRALEKMQNNDKGDRGCLLLDLDVCVPTWMRENFAKGIYPTIDQRKEFAASSCDYVDDEIKKFCNNYDDKNKIPIIISFSFVNIDLRDHFISRFPHAKWALVDVPDSVAQNRINSREGHFYKGAPSTSSSEKNAVGEKLNKDSKLDETSPSVDEKSEKTSDNSEWNFAPVNFDHVLLNGLDSVQKNADIVIEMLNSS